MGEKPGLEEVSRLDVFMVILSERGYPAVPWWDNW